MTEENNPPEICNKYDGLVELIEGIESEIDDLENQIEPKTQLVERYLKIVKDGQNLFPPELMEYKTIENSKYQTVIVPMMYYSNKLQEINEELVKNNDAIKSGIEELAKLKAELGEIGKEVKKTGWVKIKNHVAAALNSPNPEYWVSPEKFKEIKNTWGLSRII
jgi:peptidoglycan hydrolase CwlO-like protein